MFKLGKWPKGKRKYSKGGRPKKADYTPTVKFRKSQIDILKDLGFISEEEYELAIWYEKIWIRYTRAIDCPKLSVCGLERIKGGDAWSEDDLAQAESRWNKAQNILNRCGPRAKQSLEEVICFNKTSGNHNRFKSILRQMVEIREQRTEK